MELYIAIAVVILVGGYFIIKRADKNGDGKIDAAEAQAAVEEVKVVVQEAKKAVKKTAVKAKATTSRVSKATVRKSSGKKPAPKK